MNGGKQIVQHVSQSFHLRPRAIGCAIVGAEQGPRV